MGVDRMDRDTSQEPSGQFIELFDGGVGSTSLDGLVLVFFNGSSDTSYAAFDLDGYFTNAQGYFTIGNPGVAGVDLTFPPGDFGLLQNGADVIVRDLSELVSTGY